MNVKHGHCPKNGKASPEYNSWYSMKARCYNKNHQAYHRYGGAGIEVCPAWRNEFSAFLKDMGPRPAGTTLERIDNSKGYEPGNCHWATDVEQNNNKSTNVKITANGQTMTIAQWARHLGVGVSTLRSRLNRGVDPVVAVSTPFTKYRSRK